MWRSIWATSQFERKEWLSQASMQLTETDCKSTSLQLRQALRTCCRITGEIWRTAVISGDVLLFTIWSQNNCLKELLLLFSKDDENVLRFAQNYCNNISQCRCLYCICEQIMQLVSTRDIYKILPDTPPPPPPPPPKIKRNQKVKSCCKSS